MFTYQDDHTTQRVGKPNPYTQAEAEGEKCQDGVLEEDPWTAAHTDDFKDTVNIVAKMEDTFVVVVVVVVVVVQVIVVVVIVIQVVVRFRPRLGTGTVIGSAVSVVHLILLSGHICHILVWMTSGAMSCRNLRRRGVTMDTIDTIVIKYTRTIDRRSRIC
jgi:hypothetical protein